MSEVHSNLANFITKLSTRTANTSEKRPTAVRWFSRVYYDLDKWRHFLDVLSTYPYLHPRLTGAAFADFDKKMAELRRETERFHRGFGAGPMEFCARLDFFAARLAADFKWLKDEDPDAFRELARALGIVRMTPGGISRLARDVQEMFYFGAREFHDSRYDNGKSQSKRPTKTAAEEALRRYKKISDDYFHGIESAAKSAGIILLSVEEYEAALSIEGKEIHI